MRAAIMLRLLVLDDLLARGGGAYGQSQTIQAAVFKSMTTGKSWKKLQKAIRKVAPVQTGKVLNLQGNIWSWLPGAARGKHVDG